MKRCFIVGTDWWTDCDDAVAMRILVRARMRGEIGISGIVINASMEHSVASLDGFLALESCDDVDIAIDLSGNDFGGRPPYQARLAPFAKRYRSNADAEDGVRAYRRMLAEATEPVEIIEIGYPSTLAAVLKSGGDDLSELSGAELFATRVKRMWVMAGKWDKDGERENNFARNERARVAAHDFCRICPVPITFLGWEVGHDVKTGGNLAPDDHLHLVLADHGSAAGRSSWDPMLVLMALIGNEEEAGYTVVRGRAEVDAEDGRNHFYPSDNGPHSYVIRKFAPEYYKDAINSMISS